MTCPGGGPESAFESASSFSFFSFFLAFFLSYDAPPLTALADELEVEEGESVVGGGGPPSGWHGTQQERQKCQAISTPPYIIVRPPLDPSRRRASSGRDKGHHVCGAGRCNFRPRGAPVWRERHGAPVPEAHPASP
jgi:hypothetical protein